MPHEACHGCHLQALMDFIDLDSSSNRLQKKKIHVLEDVCNSNMIQKPYSLGSYRSGIYHLGHSVAWLLDASR